MRQLRRQLMTGFIVLAALCVCSFPHLLLGETHAAQKPHETSLDSILYQWQLQQFTDWALTSFGPSSDKQYTLAVCAIFQNEGPWLKEWIEFHKIVGVEHFFLFNHQSKDNYREILQPYIESGVVSVIDWNRGRDEYWNLVLPPIRRYAGEPGLFDGETDQVTTQILAYNYCLQKLGHLAKWIAFIDLDEFLFPVYEHDLQTVLRDYEGHGGLAVSWLCYGTSNVDHLEDDDLLIDRLTWCAPRRSQRNSWVKCIVRPLVTRRARVHIFYYDQGFHTVDSNYRPIWTDVNRQHPLDRIRINHYYMRTQDWAFGEKLTRLRRPERDSEGMIVSYKYGKKQAKAMLRNFDTECHVRQDRSIHRFVPLLRERMQGAKAASPLSAQ